MLDIKSKEYFSIKVEEGWILTDVKSEKDFKEYKSKIKKKKIDDLIKLINKNIEKSKMENINKDVLVNNDGINRINNNKNEKEVNLLKKVEMLEK